MTKHEYRTLLSRSLKINARTETDEGTRIDEVLLKDLVRASDEI